MDSLLSGVAKFINGYTGEVLVKRFAGFMNGFFDKWGA